MIVNLHNEILEEQHFTVMTGELSFFFCVRVGGQHLLSAIKSDL